MIARYVTAPAAIQCPRCGTLYEWVDDPPPTATPTLVRYGVAWRFDGRAYAASDVDGGVWTVVEDSSPDVEGRWMLVYDGSVWEAGTVETCLRAGAGELSRVAAGS